MTTMPRASNTISYLPSLLAVWHRCNIANELMTGNNGELISESSVSDSYIGVAYTASKDFDKNLRK